MQQYWKAVEWNPWDRDANERIVEYLKRGAPRIQVANYLRFLLEYGQTEWIPSVSTVLIDVAGAPEAAAATARALAAAADFVRPETLETAAAPFVSRAGEAGAELRAALRGESRSFEWLAAHRDATMTRAYCRSARC